MGCSDTQMTRVAAQSCPVDQLQSCCAAPCPSQVVSGISFNRWAVEAVAVQEFQQTPQYMWPATKSVMLAAGYCGLDGAVLPEAGQSLQPGGPLENLDVRVYCAGYVKYNLVVMAAEGLILRLATLVALQVRPAVPLGRAGGGIGSRDDACDKCGWAATPPADFRKCLPCALQYAAAGIKVEPLLLAITSAGGSCMAFLFPSRRRGHSAATTGV